MARPGSFSEESKRLKTRGLAVLCGFSACLVFAAARKASAETPVGLDAQGVSVSWALHNPLGLDVRDALARPVSARLVEAQIKAAQARSAEHAAYTSRLPFAKALIRFLEFLPSLKLFMAGGFPRRSRRASSAECTAPKPSPKAVAGILVLTAVLMGAASLLGRGADLRLFTPETPSLTPLRC